jgi:hypothetical protein
MREAGDLHRESGEGHMKRVEVEIEIAVSPEQVWALYADVPGSAEWVPFVEQVLYVSGPAGLGQVYRERTRLGRISSISEWRVIEWQPPRRQVQLSTDMRMDSRLIIEVEPAAVGTKLRQHTELRSRLPGALGWLHELVFSRVALRGIRQAVLAAKRTLESR